MRVEYRRTPGTRKATNYICVHRSRHLPPRLSIKPDSSKRCLAASPSKKTRRPAAAPGAESEGRVAVLEFVAFARVEYTLIVNPLLMKTSVVGMLSQGLAQGSVAATAGRRRYSCLRTFVCRSTISKGELAKGGRI